MQCSTRRTQGKVINAAQKWARQRLDGYPGDPGEPDWEKEERRYAAFDPGEPDWDEQWPAEPERENGTPIARATPAVSREPCGRADAIVATTETDAPHHQGGVSTHGLLVQFPQSAWRPGSVFTSFRDLTRPTTEASEGNIFASCLAATSFLWGRDAVMDWGEDVLDAKVFVGVLGPAGVGRKTTPVKMAVKLMVKPNVNVDPKWKDPQTGEPCSAEVVSGSSHSGQGLMEALADREYEDLSNPVPKGQKATTTTQTGRRALFIIHELGALLEAIKKDHAGNMEDFLIEAFDCDDQPWQHRTRVTKEKKPITITRGFPCILGTSTWSWLGRALSRKNIENGLVSRFMWFAGDRGRPLPKRPPIPAHVLRQFQDCVKRVYQASKARRFTMTGAADDMHTTYYNRNYFNQQQLGPIVLAATARADVYALKVAMLLAAAECTTVIDDSILDAAWSVVDYSTAIVQQLVDGMVPEGLVDVQERMLAAMERIGAKHPDGCFKKQEVWQNVKGNTGGISAPHFKAVWESLEANEVIRPVGTRSDGCWWRLVQS